MAVFLANEMLAAPPITQLGALQQVAFELSRKKLDDLPLLQQWLKVLVAPGASLGGARPKANLAGPHDSLWIAKFPAADDDVDVALWEKSWRTTWRANAGLPYQRRDSNASAAATTPSWFSASTVRAARAGSSPRQ